MQLGIFAKTFPRPTFPETLDAVVGHGLRHIQFNFACVGLAPLPETVDSHLLAKVRQDCAAHNVHIAGVSGTFNMAHPDPQVRADGIRRLGALAAATRALGASFISLCTGTRDRQDMWRAHPENDSPEAWHDLRETLEAALVIAESQGLLFGLEPESGNVVSSAAQARRLIDEMKSPRLKVILDPANLFHHGEVVNGELMRARLREALDLLAPDLHMAHAKEMAGDGSLGGLPPGAGLVDWEFYLDGLRRAGFGGPLVLHGLPESAVSDAVQFLRQLGAS